MRIQFTNLKMYRKECGYTQEAVAEKIGVSRQAIAKWERGETLPDIENCIALADLYHVTVDLLIRNIDQELHTEDGKHIFGCARLNSKGQVTLPANCRKVFQLNPGNLLLVLGDEKKGGIALVNLGSISDGIQHIRETLSRNKHSETEDETT